MSITRVPLTGLTALLVSIACNRTPAEPVSSPSPAAAARQHASSASGSAMGASGGALTRPTIEIPAGAPPTTLQTQDLVVGTGPEARSGMTVDVQYSGVAWSTHREFDSSWNRPGQPFSFRLGQGMVIPGWDQGVVGMKVGGRRRLTIPPHLGYGERGAGQDIGPNETLVFVVDLVGVR
jgi:peptidylprolyl isomerase